MSGSYTHYFSSGMTIHSALFDREGYISVREYLDDVLYMEKNGPWKLPLKAGDRLHLSVLRMISGFSWLTENLYIKYPSGVSPSYQILLSYLQKKNIFESFARKNQISQSHFSYHLEKTMHVNGRPWKLNGRGVSTDKATALSIAMGEMLERTMSGLYDQNREIIETSPKDMFNKHKVFYPPKFHRFLEIQKKSFPELCINENASIQWVRGKNLATGRDVFIPRSITSWFRENRKKDKLLFIEATSNGAAGYFTRPGAVLRGLLEVVQRDAFFVHWLTMDPPRLINSDSMPDNIRATIDDFRDRGITIYVLDATDIPIPSVLAVAITEQAEVPQVVLCGASALSFENAIESALKEMIVASEMFDYPSSSSLHDRFESEPEPFLSDLGKITRQLYWRGEEKVSHFRWFLHGEKVRFDDLPRLIPHADLGDKESLRVCCDILAKLGPDFEPIVYFPKHPVQEEIGFHIAQVFIPKAFPLYLTERYGTFDSDRLTEYARARGLTKDWRLNPKPHMFP